jgi:hypothetical protein
VISVKPTTLAFEIEGLNPFLISSSQISLTIRRKFALNSSFCCILDSIWYFWQKKERETFDKDKFLFENN